KVFQQPARANHAAPPNSARTLAGRVPSRRRHLGCSRLHGRFVSRGELPVALAARAIRLGSERALTLRNPGNRRAGSAGWSLSHLPLCFPSEQPFDRRQQAVARLLVGFSFFPLTVFRPRSVGPLLMRFRVKFRTAPTLTFDLWLLPSSGLSVISFQAPNPPFSPLVPRTTGTFG